MDNSKQDRIEKFIKKLGVQIIVYDGEVTEDTKEGYNHEHDVITMMPKEHYPMLECYYHILFHELAHWTGHCSRLDRDAITLTEEEAEMHMIIEEMTAESAAYFLCNMFDVKVPFDYVGVYLIKLASDLHDYKMDALYFLNEAYEEAQEIRLYLMQRGEGVSPVSQ